MKSLLTIISFLFYITVSAQAPTNDYIGNSQLINACGTSFNTTNKGATANYSSTQSGCGTSNRDLDCNTTTSTGGSGGLDASYTVENDIWYHFCPGVTGTWTLTITPSNCVGDGFQYSVFQGTPTNLSTRFISAGGPNPAKGYTTTQTYNINVTNTTNCIYIQIDGYAGAVCDFAVSITTTTCTLLSLDFIKLKYENNILQWSSFIENISGIFTVEYSDDLENWFIYNTINNYGPKKYYSVIENKATYYRVNFNEIYKSNIVYVKKRDIVLDVKYLNIMGQEIDIETHIGIYFIITTYDNERRIVEKKIKI